MKIRGGFACIVSLMALMVVVIVAGRTTPDQLGRAGLVRRTSPSPPLMRTPTRDGTDDARSCRRHRRRTITPTAPRRTIMPTAPRRTITPTALQAHDHADGTTEHDHADGTTTDDPTHCHTDCAPGTTEDPTHCHVDCTPGDPTHEHPTEPAIYTQIAARSAGRDTSVDLTSLQRHERSRGRGLHIDR